MLGVVCLRVALIIVGLLTLRQSKAVGAGSASAASTSDGVPSMPATSGSGPGYLAVAGIALEPHDLAEHS